MNYDNLFNRTPENIHKELNDAMLEGMKKEDGNFMFKLLCNLNDFLMRQGIEFPRMIIGAIIFGALLLLVSLFLWLVGWIVGL